MKTNLRRFAPLGLTLSLLAALSFIVILMVKGLAAGGIFTPPDPKTLDQGLMICFGIFILGLALTALLNPDKARSFLTGRQAQYGSNAIIMLVAFLGIVLFINMIVYQYSSTLFTAWDFTTDKQNTLAPETLNLLKSLKEPVTIRAYYSAQTPKDGTQKLLDSFKQNSDGKLTYRFIDPNYDPTGANNDGVTLDATLVMTIGNRKEIVAADTEKDLDTGLIKLINPKQLTVYFLIGHGERDTQNASNTSFSQVKLILQNKNYTVKVLNLNNQRAVPEDAKVVIVAGPQVPLTKEETALIETYLNKGGALIVMEEPRSMTKFGSAPDPLADLTAKWGITFEDDLVVDSNMNNPLFTVVDTQFYGQNRNPITDKLYNYTVAFYTARSLKMPDTAAPKDITLALIAKTYPTGAWGETDPTNKSVAYDPATDIHPPLVLAATAENTVTKGRLVVFGDSDFATNAYQQSDGDIFFNAVDWSTQQEDLINLTPKNNIERVFRSPHPAATIGSIMLSICVIPLLVILSGVWAWYSRRRRG